MKKYNHRKIEKKWQKKWQESGIYKVKDNAKKKKKYILDMFPYPSGDGIHIGHPRGYIPTDAYSRYLRMKGFNVLHPMGWDAFGLPAEGYALKNKIHPEKAVKENVARYKNQLSKIGLSFDWEREINTTDPDYYRWTQWIFLQMFKKGLAYQSFEPINWCPCCKTGLANEDLEDGLCERCDSEVEQKPMRQWVLRITDYADKLLKDLDSLSGWPESVKESQRNWIGKSEGAEITFTVVPKKRREGDNLEGDLSVPVFTTRPDTLFGATYLVLAPEHSLLDELDKRGYVSNMNDVIEYVKKANKKTELQRTSTDKEKTGVELKGVWAINPSNGERIPVWIADYVMVHYGTGAIMAVPAHDERDLEFADKMGLPVKYVVYPKRVDKINPPRKGKKTFARRTIHALVSDPKTGKILFLKWKKFDWTTFIVGGIGKDEDPVEAAKREVEEETGYFDLKLKKMTPFYVEAQYYAEHKDENRIAYTVAVHFELKSRKQKDVLLKEKKKHDFEWLSLDDVVGKMTCAELDVWIEWLKKDGNFAYTGDGVLIDSGEFSGMESGKAKDVIRKKVRGKKRKTYKLKDWVFSRQRYWGEPIPLIHCQMCGVVPVPEKDLPVKLPKVKSYEPTGTGESPLANITSWTKTKCPKCGGEGRRETNTMPQWAGSCWYYLRFIDPKNKKSFVFKKKEKYFMPVDMYVGGVEHATRHLIYARFWHKFLFDEGLVSDREPFKVLKNQGLVAGPDGRKMSKRWGNIISPDDVIDSVGADALRIYSMFIGPFENEVSWNPNGPIGAHRFLERVWKLSEKVVPNIKPDRALTTLMHKTIKKVSEDISSFSFNTAVSSLMILTNTMIKQDALSMHDFKRLLLLLAPLAPHITEELWSKLGFKLSIHKAKWPLYDFRKVIEDKVFLAVQVNGKTRGKIEVAKDLSEEEAVLELKKTTIFSRFCVEGQIKRVVYVPNKIINVVLSI